MQNFEEMVRSKAGELPEKSLVAAIRKFEALGRTSQSDVANCILLAGAKARRAAMGSVKEQLGKKKRKLPEADTAIVSRVLVDRLRPRAEELRTEIWGCPSPPFPLYADAVAWIEQEARKIELRRKPRVDLARLFADVQSVLERLDKVAGAPTTLAISRPELRYVSSVSEPSSELVITLGAGSPLLRIKEFVGPTASSTGFDEAALVAYVLSGHDPLIPRVSVTSAIGALSLQGAETTVVFRGHRILPRDFEQVLDFTGRRRNRRELVHEDRLVFEAIQGQGKLRRGTLSAEVLREIAREASLKKSPGAIRMRLARMRSTGRIPQDAIYRDL